MVYKSLLIRVLTALLFLPAVPLAAATADADSVAIRQLFERYIDAWNRGDLVTIGSVIYQPPLYIFEAQETRVLQEAEDIAELLGQVRAKLDAAGFSHSIVVDVSDCDLGDGLAFASFHYRRIDVNGAPMDEEPLSSAYIVRRSESGWHLAAHVMQARLAELSCVTP